MVENDVRAALRCWILDRAGANDRTDFNDRTQILEEGLLSSLDIVELILFVESLRGEEVDVDALEPEIFADVDSLYENLFARLNT